MIRQMKIKLLITICLAALGLYGYADNVVTIGSASGAPGDEVTVSVSLANTDNIAALQLLIPMDEELTYVDGSAALTDRCPSQSVTAGVKDGELSLMIYSMGMTAFTGTEGDVATFRLKLGNLPKNITLSASKLILTDTDGNSVTGSVQNGVVSIRCAKAQYSTTTIDFGRVPIRSTYQRSLTITNVGNEPLEVTGLQFSNYVTKFSSSTQFPLAVAAGGSSTINITYAPEERGTVSETVKVLCNSISKLNTITLKAEPFAVNELHVQPTSGLADEAVTVSLTMNNMDAISGFQFEFNLPAALEYVPNSFVLSDRKQDHSIVATENNGLLRIIGYSNNDKPFTGENGELATMKFVLRGRNSVTLKASKSLLTATINDQVTNVCSADYGATITIRSPRISAASTLNMGATPITEDAVKTLSVKNNGNAPLIISRVVFDKADFYVQRQLPLEIGQGQTQALTVVYPSTEEGDFETTMQIYSNDPEQRLWNVKVTGNRFAPNYFNISTADVSAFDNVSIDVAVNTYDPIVGIQFDLTYPSQVYEPFDNNHILESRAEGMSVTWRQIDNNTLRYFCYFLSDNSIAAGDGKVMSLQLRPIGGGAPLGQYTVGVKNIKLGTSEMADKYAGQDSQSSFNVLAPAGPVISHDEGEYHEPLTVAISYPRDNADIYYSIGGEFVKYTEPFVLTETATVEAYAQMFGCETEHVTKTFTITGDETGPSITEGYYSILNNGNQNYAQVKGRLEVGFSETKDCEAGTVFKLKATDGKVETLRSQGIDVPQSITRAMRYVPDVVKVILEKFELSGAGTLLGETGVDKIMEKIDASIDLDLHLENAGDNQYRIYGKTPNMTAVVNFYVENKQDVDYKLSNLEEAINNAIAKLVDKAGMGESLKNSFSLHMVWERIANEDLTEPMDDESKLVFLQEILSSEQNTWQFAYQTATFYMEFVEGKQQFLDFMDNNPEYSQYWERIKQVRPGVKYYIVEKDGKADLAREDDIVNDGSDIWTLEERDEFTINFPQQNKANSLYYTTLYTDFGYTLPSGAKALKVTGIDDYGFAITEEIGTEVAAQTPVLLESVNAGEISVTIGDVDVVVTGNLLVGNDYLIDTYEINNETVAGLFDTAKNILGENSYNNYLKEYEHLMLRNSGTVGNKYFFGLETDDMEKCVVNVNEENHCVIRSLGVENNRVCFFEDWGTNENKAFLVSNESAPIFLTIIGDVNRDGFISIADVTALVNIFLGKDNAEPYQYNHNAADVDGKNGITKEDVTALVNMILNQ